MRGRRHDHAHARSAARSYRESATASAAGTSSNWALLAPGPGPRRRACGSRAARRRRPAAGPARLADRLLDARRHEPARHLRHEARRAGRVPRPVPADRHRRARASQITERFPRQARVMDRLSIVRSVNHQNAHPRPVGPLDADRLLRADAGPQRPAEAVVRLGHRPRRGANQPHMPPYVAIPKAEAFGYQGAVYLGAAYNPFEVGADPNAARLPRAEPGPAKGLAAAERPDPRRTCSSEFDTLRRDVDQTGTLEGLNSFKAQALEMVTGDRVREAFDSEPGRPPAARPLRPAPLRPGRLAGPPAGRGGQHLRHHQHRLLGPPRRHREGPGRAPAAARRGHRGPGRGPRRPRHARRRGRSTAPASSAARRSSTATPAATTGPTASRCCSAAAA